MTPLTFKPKQVVKKLLAALQPRARDVVIDRYGLSKETERKTLEAIGNHYGITRERVRQIENYALSAIRKSEAFSEEESTFSELRRRVEELGSIMCEQELLEEFAKDKSTQNHIHFLMVVGEPFTRAKEDSDFRHRWHVDAHVASRVEEALKKLYANLSDDALISESELLENFLDEVKDLSEQYKQEEILRRWLSLSKQLDRNPLGEWGRASSSNVRAKGMRDYAYLVIKRHGSPMHFTEVAKAISDLFDKRAHVATTHNELIKDKRFVLVGRGLYALSEWGYTPGVVKDVIEDILKTHGPLMREEIVDRVKKERYVKDNTILVNLQDSSRFRRDTQGRYMVLD